MSQVVSSSEPVSLPPVSPMPEQASSDAARSRLLELARELSRKHNRRLLIEFLQIRRAVR